MAQGQEERRKHPRSRRGFKHPEHLPEGGLINHVENISCSGVLCQTRRPVPEMTKMIIVLELPSPANRHIEAEGVVIRCDAEDAKGTAFKVAILYTKLSDEDHQAIRDFVEHDLAQAEPS